LDLAKVGRPNRNAHEGVSQAVEAERPQARRVASLLEAPP
jgi:hypothetical protein